MEFMECLNEDAQKKERENDTLCTSSGRDNKNTTSAKLLDITYKSYGFNGLIETIN